MSSLNLNKAVLAGRLTTDPELKVTTSGVSVLSVSIAVGRRAKSANGGYETDFIDCTAWRQTAEMIAHHFHKGSSICVCGHIETRKWTDKDGSTRRGVDVIAEEVYFVDSKKDADQMSVSAAPAPTRPVTFEDVADGDPLPF